MILFSIYEATIRTEDSDGQPLADAFGNAEQLVRMGRYAKKERKRQAAAERQANLERALAAAPPSPEMGIGLLKWT